MLGGEFRICAQFLLFQKFPIARTEGFVVYFPRLRKKGMIKTFKFAWYYYFGFTAGAARAF